MKKIIGLVLTFILILSLTACGHEHTWTEATCTNPKTCSECGETEGEALGHTWEEATCVKPKTCSECGITDGIPLEHSEGDWVLTEKPIGAISGERTKSCLVCGETLVTEELSLEEYAALTFVEVGTTAIQGWDYFVFSQEKMTIEKVGEPNLFKDKNYQIYSEAVDSTVEYIFEKLELPESLLKRVRSTTSGDGTLTEKHGNITVTWSFDPMRDNDLYLLFAYDPA